MRFSKENALHVRLSIDNMAQSLQIQTVEFLDGMKAEITKQIKKAAEEFDIEGAVSHEFDRIISQELTNYVNREVRQHFRLEYEARVKKAMDDLVREKVLFSAIQSATADELLDLMSQKREETKRGW